MPVTLSIAAAAFAQASPASANALPAILVPELRLGMDKQQLHALWPRYRAAFGPGCTVRINPNIRDHKLYGVEIEAAEKEPDTACGAFVLAWAKSAFGAPKSSGDREVAGANCAPGNGFGYSATAQSAACGAPDVADWANWKMPDKKYRISFEMERNSKDWWFAIWPS